MLQKILLAGLFACLTTVSWADDSSRTFVSEPLRELIQRVQQESPAIAAAQAAVDAARARAAAADQPLYNPTLSLDAEHGQTTTTVAGINQSLDWGDKRVSRKNIANQELQAVQAELAATQQKIISETLSALAAYQTAREQATLAEKRSDLMQEFADTAVRRLTAGDISRLDAALAQVAHNEALMQQGRAEVAVNDAEAALAAASGLASQGPWPSFPEQVLLPPENIDVDALVERLPEIRLSLARAAAAQQRIRLMERQRRPDPTLSVRGGRDGSDTLFGIGIEIPLFVRNPYRAEVTAASAEASQAQQTTMESRRKARVRLDGTLGHYRRTAAAWQTWRSQGQPSLDEQMNLLKELWRAGELSVTEYLVQARQGIDTQVTATDLGGELRQAAVAWLRSSGLIENYLDASTEDSTSR